jgi:hypothetical protein
MSLEKIIHEPMDDGDIRFYFPRAKIMQYSDLNKFNSIEKLLPKQPDFVFVLYEDSPKNGHWTCLTRDTVNNINYFDSYGGMPDKPLSWTALQERQRLGQGTPMLSALLDKTPLSVFYNNVDYQSNQAGVNTCGRHCCFYVKNMLKYGMSLAQYYTYMNAMRKQNKMGYDEVVSRFISHF